MWIVRGRMTVFLFGLQRCGKEKNYFVLKSFVTLQKCRFFFSNYITNVSLVPLDDTSVSKKGYINTIKIQNRLKD